MTLTDDVKAAMECSNPYFNNAQVVIVPKDKADQYQTVESLEGLQFAAENGSAGQGEIEKLGNSCTATQDQATALLEGIQRACLLLFHQLVTDLIGVGNLLHGTVGIASHWPGRCPWA